MNEPTHFDLAAIRGGFAGVCAAVRGAELGLRTARLETSTDDGYLCSSRWAGGIFHVSYHDVKLSPDELLAAINRQTGRQISNWPRRLPRMPAARSTCWHAKAQGSAKISRSAGTASRWHRRACQGVGQGWQGRGPDRLLGELQRRLERRARDLQTSRLERLFRDDTLGPLHPPPSDFCLYNIGLYELGIDPAEVLPSLKPA
jgi:fumarate reductase flavoprotein subunit